MWRNARLATMRADLPGLGVVERGAIVADGAGRIAFAGPEAELPRHLRDGAAEQVDCAGRWITPGLIDCHTHLVHAGNRADEWEMRLAGASYEAVARAGGGILSSVAALRAASEDDLVRQSLPRLDRLIGEGVTAVEIKSGYGLDAKNEEKTLRAARRLGAERPVTVAATFLGAHALPPEAGGDKDAFIDRVADEMLPALAAEGLVDAVDAFCENIAFSPAQVSRVFARAKALGLPVKLHADQLSDGGGAALAASYGALSADHLEHCGEEGARALASAGTVAAMLPGAFYFIRETKKPPVALFRKFGVPMAVATDMNPGSSPLCSLHLAMNMAATLFGLTVAECWLGVTRHAARVLGLGHAKGTLAAGHDADLVVWNAESLAEIPYGMGLNPLHARVWRGM